MAKGCQRCGKNTNTTICSMFNTEMICMECKKKEELHPMYELARRVEHEFIKLGNYNYPGIGLPDDLCQHKSLEPNDFTAANEVTDG